MSSQTAKKAMSECRSCLPVAADYSRAFSPASVIACAHFGGHYVSLWWFGAEDDEFPEEYQVDGPLPDDAEADAREECAWFDSSNLSAARDEFGRRIELLRKLEPA